MSTVENLDNKIEEFWPKSGPATQEIKKYVKKYLKEKIVIKCGGRILLDPELFNNFINDITILKKLGLTPIVVHGGGPRIKKKLEKLNIKTNKNIVRESQMDFAILYFASKPHKQRGSLVFDGLSGRQPQRCQRCQRS